MTNQSDSSRAAVRGASAIALATGAVAIGAMAVGALAIGALAIGALAIRRLAVKTLVIDHAEFKSLTVGELNVESLRASDATVTNSVRLPSNAGDPNAAMTRALQGSHALPISKKV